MGFSLGRIGAVGELINDRASDNWPVGLSNELWRHCYEAGVDEAALFKAHYSYRPTGGPLLNCKQMFALLEKDEGQYDNDLQGCR
jgi:hypothetical protein